MARAAPAASRAVSIVSFLTANPSRGFPISELVSHLGMNIASAHATLAVLSDAGFVVRDPVHRTYVLGPALAATGFAALDQHPAVRAAIAQAEALSGELDAEAAVHAFAGRDLVLLARQGPAPSATAMGYPGDRTPLLAPYGAVFMAWADDKAVDAWIERSGVSQAAAAHYRAVLVDIRRRGLSVPLDSITAPAIAKAVARVRSEPTDEDAEHELTDALQEADEMLLRFDGMAPSDEVVYKTVAAPIFDPIGRVLLSLSITGPEHPVPLEDVLRLGRRVLQAATSATSEGRGRVPEFDAPGPGAPGPQGP
jgi:DNA-binding IclR family transcriptional regulator